MNADEIRDGEGPPSPPFIRSRITGVVWALAECSGQLVSKTATSSTTTTATATATATAAPSHQFLFIKKESRPIIRPAFFPSGRTSEQTTVLSTAV